MLLSTALNPTTPLIRRPREVGYINTIKRLSNCCSCFGLFTSLREEEQIENPPTAYTTPLFSPAANTERPPFYSASSPESSDLFHLDEKQNSANLDSQRPVPFLNITIDSPKLSPSINYKNSIEIIHKDFYNNFDDDCNDDDLD